MAWKSINGSAWPDNKLSVSHSTLTTGVTAVADDDDGKGPTCTTQCSDLAGRRPFCSSA